MRGATPEELFWARVDKSGDCWLWTTSTDKGGYGLANQIHWPRSRMAHRVSYELLVGPIPDGLEIDHLCRTPACVNPDHLEPVTHAENQRRRRWMKTHCPNGHDLDSDGNRYVRTSGTYQCRTCAREAARIRTGYYERRGQVPA